MKKAILKCIANMQTAQMCIKNKLAERKGISPFVGELLLVLASVVVGGILMALFGDTVKEVWQTIKTRIMDLFNYT